MPDPRDIFQRFSPQAKKILTTSQQVAESMHTGIGSEHILIAMSVTTDTVASELLKEYAISVEQIRLVLSLNDLWSRGTKGLTDEAKSVFKVALKIAAKYEHEQIEPEHLLLAMVTMRDSRAYQVISRVGVDPTHIRRQLEVMLSSTNDLRMIIEPDLMGGDENDHLHDHHHDGDEIQTEQTQFLRENGDPVRPRRGDNTGRGKLIEVFTVDLTKLARENKLDPVIGRTKEIQRTIQVLARRTKNNPILLGEPGVGKTAIVEGLAQLIAKNQVPSILEGRRLLRLDLALLVAGTMYRGQFEERIKKLMDEVARDPKIILFIDEIHTVVGTGSAEGSMDAANMLKPALARGDVRLIGATTLDDYRRSIEKDPALERRFQTILVNEPTPDETVVILKGLRSAYEKHHHVQITDAAIEVAAQLAARYITERSLPDKAIDLLDEAAAAKQLSQPNQLAHDLTKVQQRIDQLIKQKERAIEREAFAQAAALRAKELAVKEKLDLLHSQPSQINDPLVTDEDIATVVTQLTGIPRRHLIREHTLSTTELSERLNHLVLGQTEAVTTIAAAIQRAQARIAEPNRPLGSFLFLGPTGVGKTELARVLAQEVFGSQEAFIKIDMSEFMERHTVSRLVGAPPGYVGFEEGGKLTDAVRRRPYTLLLLDEVEKAHPEIQNMLLQIFEDGILTDAKGRRVSFANTIIIMTSNLGSRMLTKAQALGFQTHNRASQEEAREQYSELTERVTTSVREHFEPEFLNRLDGMIIFKPLEPTVIEQIVILRLEELRKRLAREKYALYVTDRALQIIAKHGFDPEYGARPIRRLIRDWIETPLSAQILEGDIEPGDTVRVVPHGESVKVLVGKKTAPTKKPQTKRHDN